MQMLPVEGKSPASADILSWPLDRRIARTRRYGNGRILFHQGMPVECVYEIVSGMLKLSKVTSDGHLLVLDFAVAGDVVGIADEQDYSYTAQVVGEAELHVIPRGLLMQAVEGDAGGERLLRLAAQHERTTYDHVLLLSLRHPPARVSAFLLWMASRQSAATGSPGRRLRLPMARRDIAGYLAIAPETLCRIMRQLREAGIINVIRCDFVEIVDFEQLCELADGCRLPGAGDDGEPHRSSGPSTEGLPRSSGA